MTEQVHKRGQWHVWGMMGIFAAVIIAGFLVFPKTDEQRKSLLSKLGTTNHGEFVLPPASIVDLALKTVDNADWRFSDQKIKWRMIIAGSGACIDQCREMLYLTRQVHISLGKYSRRFERLYLAQGEVLTAETAEYIQLNHPFLTTLQADKHAFARLLEKTNAPVDANSIKAYLVDQQGLIMMSYTLENSGHEMIEDIEHPMKYSPQ